MIRRYLLDLYAAIRIRRALTAARTTGVTTPDLLAAIDQTADIARSNTELAEVKAAKTRLCIHVARLETALIEAVALIGETSLDLLPETTETIQRWRDLLGPATQPATEETNHHA